MRESHTAVVERNISLAGPFTTEPHEVAWASEAIFFLRVLDTPALPVPSHLSLAYTVEISPDGIHWCPLPALTALTAHLKPDRTLHAIPVRHFGGWLRLSGTVEPQARFMIYLALKE